MYWSQSLSWHPLISCCRAAWLSFLLVRIKSITFTTCNAVRRSTLGSTFSYTIQQISGANCILSLVQIACNSTIKVTTAMKTVCYPYSKKKKSPKGFYLDKKELGKMQQKKSSKISNFFLSLPYYTYLILLSRFQCVGNPSYKDLTWEVIPEWEGIEKGERRSSHYTWEEEGRQATWPVSARSQQENS